MQSELIQLVKAYIEYNEKQINVLVNTLAPVHIEEIRSNRWAFYRKTEELLKELDKHDPS